MSRCEGQGTASSVLRAVWMLARLPAERGTRPPPKTARLERGWDRRTAGGAPRGAGRRWDGKEEQLGEEGWDVGGGMEEAHPQEALQEVALGNQRCPQSREQLGTPSPKAPCASGAESSGASCSMHSSQGTGPFPCPPWRAQAHRGFGDFSAGTAGRHHPQQVPRPVARPSQGSWRWLSPSVPTGTSCCQRSHSTPPDTPSLQPILVNH